MLCWQSLNYSAHDLHTWAHLLINKKLTICLKVVIPSDDRSRLFVDWSRCPLLHTLYFLWIQFWLQGITILPLSDTFLVSWEAHDESSSRPSPAFFDLPTCECLVQVCHTQHPSDDVVVESAANRWRRLWRHRTSYWRGPASLRRPFLGEHQAWVSMGNCLIFLEFFTPISVILGIRQVLLSLRIPMHCHVFVLTSMHNNCSRCQISALPHFITSHHMTSFLLYLPYKCLVQ